VPQRSVLEFYALRVILPDMAAPFPVRPQFWGWFAIAVATAGLVYLLSPILAPFLFAAILAYVLNPLVEKLSGRYLPRGLAIALVLLLALGLIVALALGIVPQFYKELRILAGRLPAFFTWINRELGPWLKQRYGIDFQLDVDTIKQTLASLLAGHEQVVTQVLGSLKVGGLALIGFVINLLLVPVVLFYLLRDWNLLRERVDAMIPRRVHARVHSFTGEIDAVLAEFLRGEMIVILIMTLYYVLALWLAGLEFALPIGICAGVLVFIPYVGALTGFTLATIAGLMQFGHVNGVIWVWVAFAIGQTLEGWVITPLLVGERIGLHPVAVIFALLAFGQLFGFFGVLLALPASAALLVGLRHLKQAYLASALYGGDEGG
jgi:predicted PurR-regulated permease PerM